LPNQIGTGEGFCRKLSKVIQIDGAAATFFEDYDLEVPLSYVALIHAVFWLRDGTFNAGAGDIASVGVLYANQTKSGALSANLSEYEDAAVIDWWNSEQALVGAAATYLDFPNINYRTYFPKPMLVQKGKCRLYVATGGTMPSNNYIGCSIIYELAKVSPGQLATLLSGSMD